ncbi:DUF1642 domain-containing protein [Enterococcus casseliflavus]|uniref:DUF1642 domain-containing protein n=1 Tax=Enterococcus casseliflavus TaxID=37734 RepID=UPI0011A3A95F|nr:DUF1642 domain-containing protein [Enterococcus casseliflavus]
MNKQEIIRNIDLQTYTYPDEPPKGNYGPTIEYKKGFNSCAEWALNLMEQLDEQPKVTVPKFVADWIKQCKEKATLADCLDGYYEISNGEGVCSEDFQNWVVDNENDELTAKAWMFGYEVEKLPVFPLSQGDLVIRKGKHEAKIYIVESVSESGVLLVNGIKDEFYSVDDEGGPDNDLDYFYSNFRLLAKKESLEAEE